MNEESERYTNMATRQQQLEAFDRLLTVMDNLREHCPWDRKQTFDSLRENTIEETYELSSAITHHNMNEIKKELGDVLLHIVFYAKMGSETGDFDIADVCNSLCDKLIFRHPHVYGAAEAAKYGNISIPDAANMSPEEVKKLWEQVKQKEKDGNTTILSGVPEALPSLIKAYRVGEKAANSGFDWNQPADVWDKVKEELAEFEAEIRRNAHALESETTEEKKQVRADMEGEFGDLLFSLVNAARLYHIHPDNALERTNQKFISRFTYLEQEVKKQGRSLSEMTLDEMEAIWQESKKYFR